MIQFNNRVLRYPGNVQDTRIPANDTANVSALMRDNEVFARREKILAGYTGFNYRPCGLIIYSS